MSAFLGLFTVTVEDILEDVSFALIEPVVDTFINSIVSLGGNLYQVSPGSMVGIYDNAILLTDAGTGVQEQVSVENGSITTTSFNAIFINPHAVGSTINAATFPSGQTDHPLFTQPEVIGYLADVQNDFLLKTRCIFGVTGTFVEPANSSLVAQQRFYPQPPYAIRVERVAKIIPGQPQPIMDLYDTTQSDLDMTDYAWAAESDIPNSWFRDQINTGQLGVNPMPNVNGYLEMWYSKRAYLASDIIPVYSTLAVPDVMSHYIKYGILHRCWSKDGEARDPLRADYCRKRYEFGIKIVQRFMDGIDLDTGAPEQKYSPMAVPQG